MKYFLIFSVLLISLSLFFAQSKKQVCFSYEQKMVYSKLISGLESHRSPQEIQAILGKDISWGIIKDSKLEEGDSRPPFRLTEVSVKNFSHLSFQGELRLLFFNDRLMTTIFYPVEFKRYSQTLIETQKLRLKNAYYKQREAMTSTYTRILVPNEDYIKELNGNPSVTWEDTRLTAERDAWIMEYS